jgi:hypothetical protein
MLVRAMFAHEFTTFRNPKTFSGMLIAKGLTDRDPRIPPTSDKFAVREYVAQKIGREYLIALYQCVERADDIDFDSLPERYVIKGTHGSDMTVLVRDSSTVNRQAVKDRTARWLATDFSKNWKEWAYSNITPRLVIEEFIGGDAPPPDYKFFVFAGDVAFVQLHRDRFTGDRTTDAYDTEWNQLRSEGIARVSNDYVEKPPNFDRMLEIASALGADFSFARIDLYNVAGKIYFGEITHLPGGGRLVFKPREFDVALGQFWRHRTPLPTSLRMGAAEAGSNA